MLLLVLVAGFVAGVINTLAGSGSLITLPLLVFLGLPANVANGTNRIGVLFQNIIAVGTIRARSGFSLRGSWWVVGWCTAGALAGAQVAVQVDERWMDLAIGLLMAVMLVVVLLKPEKWLRPPSEPDPTAWKRPLNIAAFLAIGFYGGFIQAGVGIFLLSALVLSAGYDLVRANALKLVVVLVFSVPALAIFVAGGQVEWKYGLLLAAGQAAGAWFAARFATGNERAAIWIHRLLIAVILVSGIRFLLAFASA
jgi:uncharacterized membrane protein YfcA